MTHGDICRTYCLDDFKTRNGGIERWNTRRALGKTVLLSAHNASAHEQSRMVHRALPSRLAWGITLSQGEHTNNRMMVHHKAT